MQARLSLLANLAELSLLLNDLTKQIDYARQMQREAALLEKLPDGAQMGQLYRAQGQRYEFDALIVLEPNEYCLELLRSFKSIFLRLAPQFPDDFTWQLEYAGVSFREIQLNASVSLADIQASRDSYQRVLNKFPEHRRALLVAQSIRYCDQLSCKVLMAINLWGQALRTAEQVVQDQERADRALFGRGKLINALGTAEAYNLLGSCLRIVGRTLEGDAKCEKSLEIIKSVVRRSRDFAEFKQFFALKYMFSALDAKILGRNSLANALMTEAEELMKGLKTDHADKYFTKLLEAIRAKYDQQM